MKKQMTILCATAAASFLLPLAGTAQTLAPDPASRPVVSPGKAGAGSDAPQAASPAINVTLAELMQRGDAYAGRNVTVTSRLEELLTPWAMKLDEEQLLAGGIDNDMLVIGKEPLVALGVERSWVNREISVTGVVKVLRAEDFRREYGRGIDDRLFRRYEGKPALIASSVSPVQPVTGSSGSAASTGASTVGSGGAGGAGTASDGQTSGGTGITAECRPSSVHCPVTDSSGSVTSTDSLPIGSAPPKDSTITESQYPTSPGSGSIGSGSTGVPAGPARGPVLGIGR